ncbi:deoxyribodipyrimidine photo-lyase [Sporosarcina sp. BI001-red]|uniref:cryptochrome/photolyase family protein n=1 Tax=Sporosarcina sp. BI001-red TaxID=2282866 RepID=UPI000E230F56|nr:deoxyribodipyrimidine photo-lyase [Sporosarcina sp. BI001-red]REB07305.1 deoxyribodipyrimidine photo-lyase [Sporosarcina sp. BI001-red]
MKTIVWFRNDLRLHDHPALKKASECGEVLPVFILPDHTSVTATDWWLYESLKFLQQQLLELGTPLTILKGNPSKRLSILALETQADSLFFNGQIDPVSRKQEMDLLESESLSKVDIQRFEPNMLLDPNRLKTGAGQPYKVFGAFWKSLQQQTIPWPLAAPTSLTSWIQVYPGTIPLEQSGLRSPIDWDASLEEAWTPGETASFEQWGTFRDKKLTRYDTNRDFPAINGTSRLSGYLASGNMSIRSLWHAVRRAQEEGIAPQPEPFLRQLAWREFSYYQLFHFPHITERPLRSEFLHFPWRDDPEGLIAWKKGKTGYPLVDAGMRELWETGTIHNRVRMVVASFLIKHLLIDWRIGSEWFRETLVDYDVANNTLGWQWVAGSGFDAAPYFRIFNPTMQSKKFDKNGAYIRRWVPELDALPDSFLHEPHRAPEETLAEAGVVLGDTYPLPIVDHAAARARALEAYALIKGKKEGST